ncbi:hypothetical protein ZOSMA_270G00060 [Zostera marina]|uniref:Uncharacterized protein n=1 Tax=Zostera marina TaxID=29655 RepID=A0A0K9PE48_ZOSMR|nr:hypothetical protein ZOSMA_270G00060 [Zostera marina]
MNWLAALLRRIVKARRSLSIVEVLSGRSDSDEDYNQDMEMDQMMDELPTTCHYVNCSQRRI